jgi:hypothetical protein
LRLQRAQQCYYNSKSNLHLGDQTQLGSPKSKMKGKRVSSQWMARKEKGKNHKNFEYLHSK